MKTKDKIIKYAVVILSVLNLIWLFGFEYRLPARADRPKKEEAAVAATTAAEVALAEEKEPAQQTEMASEEEPEEFKEESEEEIDEESEEEAETDENVVHCRVTASSSLNVREGPGTNYKVVTTAKRDEILVYLGVEDGWAHIRKDSGQEGYVSASYIEIVEEEQPE